MRRLSAAVVVAFLVASCTDPPNPPVPPGTARPAPTPAPAPKAPAPRKFDELAIEVKWDEATRATHRRIGGVEYAKDEDLEHAVRDAQAAAAREGKPDRPVTIVSDDVTPWADVMAVVTVVKRCGVDNVQFSMGTPPAKDDERK